MIRKYPLTKNTLLKRSTPRSKGEVRQNIRCKGEVLHAVKDKFCTELNAAERRLCQCPIQSCGIWTIFSSRKVSFVPLNLHRYKQEAVTDSWCRPSEYSVSSLTISWLSQTSSAVSRLVGVYQNIMRNFKQEYALGLVQNGFPYSSPRLPQRLNALSPLLNLNGKQPSQEQFY